jgi:TolA-binding protein
MEQSRFSKKNFKYIAIVVLLVFIIPVKINGKVVQDIDKTYKYAELLFETQAFTLAKNEYLKILISYPENEHCEDALYKVGTCLWHEGSYTQAIQQWEKLENSYPNSKYIPNVRKGIEYLKIFMYDYEPTAMTVEELLANEYINWGIQSLQKSKRNTEFEIQYKTDELESALYWFKEAIEICPKDSSIAAKAQFKIGDAYLYQEKYQDYDNAIIEYQKVINNYSSNYWTNKALKAIAVIYKDFIRDKNKAIDIFTKLAIRNNCELNNYFVRYSVTQLKYLEGSLDFINNVNKKTK